jgi:hypothetical protein
MSYAKLGISCGQRTIAFTDNKKFIPFNDPVYNLQYTLSDVYPGSSNVVSPNNIKTGNLESPDFIKNFYGKNTLPEYNMSLESRKVPSKSCGCGTI